MDFDTVSPAQGNNLRTMVGEKELGGQILRTTTTSAGMIMHWTSIYTFPLLIADLITVVAENMNSKVCVCVWGGGEYRWW